MMRHTCVPLWHRTHGLRHALVMCLLGALVVPAARAQDSTASETTPWVHGGSFGMVAAGRDRITTVGLHFTQARAGHVGLDFSFGTAPTAIPSGVLTVAARGGLTRPIEFRRGLLLLPSAGMSYAGIASGDAVGETFGYNVGSAAFLGAGTTRLRTGVTWHRMRDADRGYWLLELGFVNFPDQRDALPETPPI
ncbi:hypothetical protein BH11GEM2_BH11GEM2_10340 [soil metagenome]